MATQMNNLKREGQISLSNFDPYGLNEYYNYHPEPIHIDPSSASHSNNLQAIKSNKTPTALSQPSSSSKPKTYDPGSNVYVGNIPRYHKIHLI